MSNIVFGLDIGSSTIKAAVGEVRRDGGISLRSLFKMPSGGMRRGAVSDVGDVTRALSPVLMQAKAISKTSMNRMYLSFGSSDITLRTSTGVVAVSRADYEIHQEDIARAIQSAQAINLPPNRSRLHSIVREYIVDGVGDIKDPIEMVGNRLEVSSVIIDAFAPAMKNLTKCVEILGGTVQSMVLTSLADARIVLTKSQRELGTVLVDIGSGTTGMCVYEENKLRHAAVLPVGSSHVTNDLAIGLKIPIEVAETIKVSYGTALAREAPARESIDLAKLDPKSKGTASKKFIAEIIEARIAEVFELVNNELTHIGRKEKLPGGVVFVGGGAKLPGIVELAKAELRLPAQVGLADAALIDADNVSIAERIEDPEFICVLGLLLSGYDAIRETKVSSLPIGSAFKRVLRYFAP